MLFTLAGIDKLQLVTDAAVPVDCLAIWSDQTPSLAGRTQTVITTATTADIVPVPTAISRRMSGCSIRNKHPSNSVNGTVNYNANTTISEIHKQLLAPGSTLAYDPLAGVFKYYPATAIATLFKVLAADATGQNIATVQPWFPSGGAVTLPANSTYLFEGALHTTRAAGVTSHTTGVGFGGTATLTGIEWFGQCSTGDAATLLASNSIVAISAANLQVKAASIVATEVIKLTIQGVLRVNAAGTFIPQFTYSAIPGGVPTIKANSYFRLTPLGNGAVVQEGAWA